MTFEALLCAFTVEVELLRCVRKRSAIDMTDEKSLQEFTNSELKEILKKMNLLTAGNKTELLARILAANPEDHCLRGNDVDTLVRQHAREAVMIYHYLTAQ